MIKNIGFWPLAVNHACMHVIKTFRCLLSWQSVHIFLSCVATCAELIWWRKLTILRRGFYPGNWQVALVLPVTIFKFPAISPQPSHHWQLLLTVVNISRLHYCPICAISALRLVGTGCCLEFHHFHGWFRVFWTSRCIRCGEGAKPKGLRAPST